jgi:non-heme chloroperoxidase
MLTERETREIDAANASARTPVVFIHGLWLLPSSWGPWREVFDQAGYVTVAPSWPDDPETVEEARANPQVFAKKTTGQIAAHVADVIGRLTTKPAVVGHSFGGLLAQITAGRGLSAATFAVDARRLYDTFNVPGAGTPLFEAAAANLNPRAEGVTEIVEVPNRGHSLTIDSGWREVADTALAFIKRFV